MRRLIAFVEDEGHRVVIGAVVRRMSESMNVPVDLVFRTSRGGHGRVLRELREYARVLRDTRATDADCLLVATDANCRGPNEKMREINEVLEGVALSRVYAIPDPHVERWLLLDAGALSRVFDHNVDVTVPDKCERDIYKNRLMQVVEKAGLEPLAGGLEFAENIIAEYDLMRTAWSDSAFGVFLAQLRAFLNRIRET